MRTNQNLTLRVVAGEYMLIDTEFKDNNTEIYSLNETAAYIWQKLQNKESFVKEDITHILEEEYEIDNVEDIRTDIEDLLNEWVINGLVLV